MSALGCVLGSRSTKLHVPAAQHMHPGNHIRDGDRSLGLAATDSTTVLERDIAGLAVVEFAEQPPRRERVEGQSVPAETDGSVPICLGIIVGHRDVIRRLLNLNTRVRTR